MTDTNTATTWARELAIERERVGDTSPVVAVAPNEDVLDDRFSDGGDRAGGHWVLVWTEDRVYFPVIGDEGEWLWSAPRNPQEQGQAHLGGDE